MKVVFNTLSLGMGGAERVITNLCSYLADAGHKVTIISAILASPRYILHAGIQLQSLDTNQVKAKQNKILRFLRRRGKLGKIIQRLAPDVVVSFLPEPDFLILSLRHKVRSKIIISIRSDPSFLFKNVIYRGLMKALYPHSDGYVFQTQAARDYFKATPQIWDPACIIPNPVNMDFAREPFRGKRSNEIVAVGRLEPQKNYHNLILAFSKLGSQYGEYRLTIYGEGTLRYSLQALIDDLDLQERITLAGEQSNIKELIHSAAAFVLSSDNEGMPNALIEAMCMGLPVVSTDCPIGGPSYLINHGVNGLLCKVNDPDDLTSKLESLLANPELCKSMSLEATKLTEQVNPERVGRMWQNYIGEVCDVDLNQKEQVA